MMLSKLTVWLTYSGLITDNFAAYFESICVPWSSKRNEEFKLQYNELRSQYQGSAITESNLFDVELISILVETMANGKAAGLDELSVEHLKFCHPIIMCILYKLFNLFITTGHIPGDFGASYTVPIPKCDGRSRALSVDDFRGISISSVISKLFEMAIQHKFATYFITSDHQFGFKKHLSCNHAIYCVRNVVESFIANRSTVNVCTLDLSKAFDRVNHHALLIKLMKRKLPIEVLSVLECWFSVSKTCVKWNTHISKFFKLIAGVRQGGVLSPLLFAIFIDDIILKAAECKSGCSVSFVFVNIFLYADDIVLIAPTVTGLQRLLNVCEIEL